MSSTNSSLIVIILVITANAAYPPSLRYSLPVSTNTIQHVKVACDSQNFNVTISLQQSFKGILFAKDFSQECNAIGMMTNMVSINLPTSGCGVRLSSKLIGNYTKMIYGVVLVVQQDRHLRQIADLEKYVECVVSDDAFSVRSRSLEEFVNEAKTERFRTARMQKDDTLATALLVARAWMEITPEHFGSKSPQGTLQVGEPTLLTFKSTLPVGIGWRVVDCTAHDGLGDTSQKLLDEDGCPLDKSLLSSPEFGPVKPIALMQHQEAIAQFAAFKFPDRDRLHLACGLQLCRKHCLQTECTKQNADNRLGRTLSKGEEGEILDRLEVFNSIEVLSPGIDDLSKSDEKDDFSFEPLPNRTFCVSADKIAITFCILGIIFLSAVLVAAGALLKAKKSGIDGTFYTTSIFSSSSGSAYGSKLLHENSCLGYTPPRGVHYGRI